MTYLKPVEVAQRLGVSKQQVQKWLDAGRIKSVRIAGMRLIAERHAKKPKPLKPGPKRAK
jgi:excisionase family DNA binding protein